MASALSFAFGGDTGIKTAADLDRQRILVEALMGRQAAPKNLGEGLTALGEAIGFRMAKGRLAKDEGAASDAGNKLFQSLFGGNKDLANPAQPASYNTDPVEPPVAAEPSFADSFLPQVQQPEPAMPAVDAEMGYDPNAPEDLTQGAFDLSQAQPIPEPMPAAAPQQVAQADAVPGTPEFQDLISKYEMVLGDPNFQHVDPARQKLAYSRYQQLLEAQQQASDPMRQMQLETGRVNLDILKNPKPEPPKIRDYIRGNQRVTEEWNGSDWVEISQGDAFKTTPDSVVNVGGEVADGELRKKLQGKEGENWAELQNVANVSAQTAQDLSIVDELITMAPQGPVVGRLASAFPGVSSSGAALDSIVKRLAPTLRVPGSGSTSDIEYEGMLRGYPALRNKPEANRLISQIMKSKAQINVERGQIVDQYSNGEIDAATARSKLAEINRRSILTPEMKVLLMGVDPGRGDSELEGALKQYGD